MGLAHSPICPNRSPTTSHAASAGASMMTSARSSTTCNVACGIVRAPFLSWEGTTPDPNYLERAASAVGRRAARSSNELPQSLVAARRKTRLIALASGHPAPAQMVPHRAAETGDSAQPLKRRRIRDALDAVPMPISPVEGGAPDMDDISNAAPLPS